MLTDLMQKLLGPRRAVRKRWNAVAAPAESLEDRALLAVTFKFDYRFDSRNFFDASAKNALNVAGDILASRMNDTLDAITPGGGNSWTANFTNPGTGNSTTLSNLSIGANEILIFPAGRDLGTGLGRGGWGGFSWNGNSEWGETVALRGEADGGNDFGPWGGTLAVNDTRDWHFGTTVEGLDSNEFDFVSVAVHELTHALGFASGNASYDRYITGSSFSGPRSVAEYDGSGNVPLSADLSHWANNTTDNGQRTLMDPAISAGIRELPTFLDWAGLDDIGWEINRAANDFGDAPSNRYPTLASQNGARHNTKAGLYLGAWADGETDGRDSDDADSYDDEDGVRILDTLFSGDTARIDLTANRDATINAWIDFNLDGDWDDAGEQILTDVSLTAGQNRVTIDVPDNARSGISYARFRLNSNGGLSPVGAASDGEVEDYEVRIVDGVLAIDDTESVSSSSVTNIDVLSNDLPSNRIEVRSITQPGRGSASINSNGTIRFDPEGETGTTFVDYTIGLNELQLEGTAANDQLGRVTVVDGDTLVVAASTATTGVGSGTGKVLIYRRDGLDWDLVQTITANDQEQGDRFGFSVDLSENTLVVGSRGDDDNGTNSGSAYVYERTSETGSFSFSQKLLASDGRAKDQFGQSVSVDGNFIAVGARLDDNGGSGSGSVEIFERSAVGSDFAFTQRLRPDEVSKGDQFGFSVNLDGSSLFVGAWRDDHSGKNDAGSVYAFTRSGSSYNLTTQILPGRPSNFGYFGFSLAVSGSRLAVGQPSLNREARTGRAYVFDRNVGGSNNFGLVKQIDPADANGGNRFGLSVALLGNQLVVGSPKMEANGIESGEVRVYDRNTGGTDNWGLTHNLVADNAGNGDDYGFSTATSGDQIFVGARFEDSSGSNSGSLYVEDLRVDIGRLNITI
jgi:hypothetical protein